MLKTGKAGHCWDPTWCRHSEWLGLCLHTCVSTCVWAHVCEHTCTSKAWPSQAGPRASAQWEPLLRMPAAQKSRWFARIIWFLMCHQQIPSLGSRLTANLPQSHQSTKPALSPCPSPLPLQIRVRGSSTSPWHTTALQSRELHGQAVGKSLVIPLQQQTWCGARESSGGTKLVLICSRANSQLKSGTGMALAVKERDGSICNVFFCGLEPLEGKEPALPLPSPLPGTALWSDQHCVLSPHLWDLISHPKSQPNQENAPGDCSCWQARAQRSAGLLPWSAAGAQAHIWPVWLQLEPAGSWERDLPCGFWVAETGISQAESKGKMRWLSRF